MEGLRDLGRTSPQCEQILVVPLSLLDIEDIPDVLTDIRHLPQEFYRPGRGLNL